MDLLSRLITDIKFPIDNDLDLVVCILVDQRRALLQPVKASRYRSCWVVGLGGRNITEVGVLVGDQGRLEGGLSIAVVCECWGRHFCGGFFGGAMGGVARPGGRVFEGLTLLRREPIVSYLL
jgi:hypothetical protein